MKVFFFGCILAASSATIAGCHSDESAAPAPVQTMQARVVESHQQEAPLTRARNRDAARAGVGNDLGASDGTH